jgi:antitoxin CptB
VNRVAIPDFADPVSGIRMRTAAEHRTRWQCRRGLLELDLVLARFMDRHYPGLDVAQRHLFDELLELEDNELWEVVAGRAEPERGEFADLVALLRQG